MPNPENIVAHRFKKGNKAAEGYGRPKGKSLTTILQEAMDKEVTVKGETKLTSEWLVAIGIKNALQGDFRYFKEIYDRLEGRPLQSIETQSKMEVDLSTLSDEQLDRQIDRLFNKTDEI